jgi:hypothetical protein
VQGALQQTNPGLTPTRVPFHFRPRVEQQFSGTCQSAGQIPRTTLSQASFTSDWQQTLLETSRNEEHFPPAHEQRNCLLPLRQSVSVFAASQKLSLQQTASATFPAQLKAGSFLSSIHLKSLPAIAEPEKMSKSELKYIVWDFMTSTETK